MQVLVVSSKYMPEYSGSGYRAHKLYSRLLQKVNNLKAEVLCGSVTENSSAVYEYEGMHVTRIAGKHFLKAQPSFLHHFTDSLNFLSEYRLTCSFLKEKKDLPDIIHIFGRNYVTASAAEFARKNNIPLIIELCNDMDSPFQYVPFPARLFASAALPEKYLFVCISPRLEKVCLKAGIAQDRIWCRPNPVDEKRFQIVSKEKKYALRKKLSGFDTNKKLISYIAKFKRSKNHIFLIEVMKQLPEDFVLFMKGPLVESGPLAEKDREVVRELQEKIHANGLSSRVKLEVGFCENVEEYYQMSDIYAFPTKHEGLGTPLLEAIASGIPLVANLIPGITDYWIQNGRNGYISKLDVKEFAKKILASLSIPEEVLKLSSSEIISKCGTTVIDNEYIKLLTRLSQK